MFVVDASVWVAFFVEADANHPEAYTWLLQVVERQVPIFGPTILLAEVAGAISRRLQSPNEGLRAIDHMLRETRLTLLDLDEEQGYRVGVVAANLRLRGYDAAYAAIAGQLNLPLVTLDNELRARTEGFVTSLTPAEARIS